MYTAADFSKAIDDYIQFNRELKANQKPMDEVLGVLGFGKKPGHDPGHEEFFREMDSVMKQVCASQPDSAAADAVMDVIFRARDRYADEGFSPFIFSAIEGMTRDLIPFLSVEKAQQIYARLKKAPVEQRTPVRKELMRALAKRTG